MSRTNNFIIMAQDIINFRINSMIGERELNWRARRTNSSVCLEQTIKRYYLSLRVNSNEENKWATGELRNCENAGMNGWDSSPGLFCSFSHCSSTSFCPFLPTFWQLACTHAEIFLYLYLHSRHLNSLFPFVLWQTRNIFIILENIKFVNNLIVFEHLFRFPFENILSTFEDV